jgi:hypothetical protein
MMKFKRIPKQAMICLITGLLLVSFTPIIARHAGIPDFVRGLLSGLGVALETFALLKIQRSKKSNWLCNAFPVLNKQD